MIRREIEDEEEEEREESRAYRDEEEDPGDGELAEEGRMWYERGRVEDAVSVLRRALEIHTRPARGDACSRDTRCRCRSWKLMLARSLAQSGCLDEAISEFSEIIRLDPYDAQAHLYRGMVYKELGKYEQAVLDFTVTLFSDRKNVRALEERGDSLRHQGVFKDAIADFFRVLELRQDSSVFVHQSLGQCFASIGNLDHAHHHFEKAWSLNSDPLSNRDSVLHLAVLKYKLSMFEDASLLFSQILICYPDDVDIWNNRGLCYFHIGQYSSALNDHLTALSFAPSDADTNFNLGYTHLRLGDVISAARFFKQALRCNHDHESAYLCLLDIIPDEEQSLWKAWKLSKSPTTFPSINNLLKADLSRS